jgi:ribosomal protein L34E
MGHSDSRSVCDNEFPRIFEHELLAPREEVVERDAGEAVGFGESLDADEFPIPRSAPRNCHNSCASRLERGSRAPTVGTSWSSARTEKPSWRRRFTKRKRRDSRPVAGLNCAAISRKRVIAFNLLA